jgi:UDP-N-acetylmuramate dehydrogenase
VLGGGSNVLVADRGFEGVVLRARIEDVALDEQPGRVVVTAGAGYPWDRLVAIAVDRGWAGLECLSGIPGDVGATPIQNVGAYGQDVSETIAEVQAIDRASREARVFSATECGFGYRDSVFKRELKDRFVITRVTFALTPGGAPAIRYAELEKALANEDAPSLARVRDTVVALRRAKSMVLDPSDENGRSAGSFFMNPTLDDVAVERVLATGKTPPRFAAGAGLTKVPAGWLIENAGFAKGMRDGNVGLSTKHALAITNRGGATAAEIVAFARKIRDGVGNVFGIRLRPEPVFLGFPPGEIDDLVTP